MINSYLNSASVNSFLKNPACEFPEKLKCVNPEELPKKHPFAENEEKREAYSFLSKELNRKIDVKWSNQFSPLKRTLEQTKKLLQPPLMISGTPTISTDLTASDTHILSHLGFGDNPIKSSEMVNSRGRALLKKWVETDSHRDDIEGNKKMRTLVATEFKKLGASIDEYPEEGVTIARFRTKNPHAKKILLLGHTDTVPLISEFQPSFLYKDGKVYGAGVADMKGGLVIMVTALKALYESGSLKDRHVTVLLNSDEELGSEKSRALIESEAIQHNIGFVFEAGKQTASSGGGVTLERKGLLAFDINIHGISGHTGVSHHKTIDAGNIAFRIAAHINALTDYKNGITGNSGIIKVNANAARNRSICHAKLSVEIRHWDASEIESIKEKVTLIIEGAMQSNPYIGRCSSYSMHFRNRPPIRATKENKQLYLNLAEVSKSLGRELGAVSSGGGSDQNFLINKGLHASIDSLGLNGQGLHSSNEWGDWDFFLYKSQLVALAIHKSNSF